MYGLLLTASVSWPPSLKPTYPGGEPINLLTVCLSINSDISNLIMASSLPKKYEAKDLVNSVFPTPVGPEKIKLAIGLLGFFKPTLALLIALDTALTASS